MLRKHFQKKLSLLVPRTEAKCQVFVNTELAQWLIASPAATARLKKSGQWSAI